MLFSDITVIDENFNVLPHRYVGVKGDKIAYISDKKPMDSYGEEYCGKNKLLIPAFYNAHSHLPMCLMRGYGENLPLMTWLQGRIFPFEKHLTDADIYNGCMMGITEMLRYGIAATQEMYLSYEPLCQAVIDSGIKAAVSKSCSWMDNTDYFDLPIFGETVDAIKKYNGAESGRLKVEFSLHAEYTSTEKIAKGIAEAAAKYNSSMHVHVAETKGEVNICRRRHQRRSPVKYLADCGIFDIPAVAAHCVYVDGEDIEILKSHNVSVATCPKSNAKLASGICKTSELINAGINVAIGTDSVASNNNLNMIEEMRFFNLLQKAKTLDPTVITSAQTLYAATRAGALAQGRADSGFIKEGFKADIAVLNLDEVYLKPAYNVLDNLIFSASGNDVVLTMADGRVLYRDGDYPTLDYEKIEYNFENSRQRILDQVEKAEIAELKKV